MWFAEQAINLTFGSFRCVQCFKPFPDGVYFEVRTKILEILTLYFDFSTRTENIVNMTTKHYMHLAVLDAVSS